MSWLKKLWNKIFGIKNNEQKPISNPVPPSSEDKPIDTSKPIPIDGATTFDKAFLYTLYNEGTYSDIPEDKGGPTNWGIIQEELSRWRGYSVSKQDMKDLTQAEAKLIYKAWYWDKLNLDRIKNEKVALALFDRAILNGLAGVSRFVRAIYDAPVVKNSSFDELIDKVNAHDPKDFVLKLARLCAKQHMDRVEKDPSQRRFLKGWLARVTRMEKELT